MITTAAQFEEEVIRERIRIRTEQAEEVKDEYNRLQNRMNVLQEKAELLAYENFKDQNKLNKIIQQNQINELADTTI